MSNNYDEKKSKDFLELISKYEQQTDLQFWRIIKSLELNKESIVIDLGCGPGRDLSFLSNELDFKHLFGVDISESMCRMARNRLNNVEIRTESYIKTTFADDSFDLIISRYAIQIHSTPDEVWQEICRLLKPEGFGVCLITHPIFNFIKKKFSYFKKESIKFTILGKISAEEPTHTFQEYLSPFFLKNFDIISFEEGQKQSEEKFPDYFIIAFQKRKY